MHGADAQDATPLAVVAAEVTGPAEIVAVYSPRTWNGAAGCLARAAMRVRAVDDVPGVVEPAGLDVGRHSAKSMCGARPSVVARSGCRSPIMGVESRSVTKACG